MIHRLEIENFYSIRETQVIDLRIGAKVPDEEGRFAEIKDGSGERVPKTVAFFGANASGKSTVLKALAFLQWFLVQSFSWPPDAPIPTFRFADGNRESLRIKVSFDWLADMAVQKENDLKNTKYAQYSYEVKIGGTADRSMVVLSEELREQPAIGKSRILFKREIDGGVQGGSGFSMRGLAHIVDKLRPSVSLAATIAQFAEHGPTMGLLKWASGIIPNISNAKRILDEKDATEYYANYPGTIKDLQKALRRVDIGIKEMLLVNTPNGIQPFFVHGGLEQPIPLSLESEGTKQFVCIYPHLWHALHLGGIAVIDEMDSTIHPMLLPEILHWFYDSELNPHKAQLWFSGHSASLLEELKKEEIFFTEKDNQGRTKIYGLKDIEGVRRVDNFYQKYLGGVYGAVPRIG
jgi:hypothetical protein